MRNQTFTITSTGLSITSTGYIDCRLWIPYTAGTLENSRTEYRDVYPQKIRIINDTGTAVEVILLKDESEKEDFEDHPTLYGYIRILDDNTYEETLVQEKVSYIGVKLVSGSASSEFRVDCINYTDLG